MVVDGTPAITLTFILAFIGYLGLTYHFHRAVWGDIPQVSWRITVAVIMLHVLMIWHFRYQWDVDLALRNGSIGFILFHTAALIISATIVLPKQLARVGIAVSFCVVSLGAAGASFRYDAVSIYRIPIIAGALVGVVSAMLFYRSKRKQ